MLSTVWVQIFVGFNFRGFRGYDMFIHNFIWLTPKFLQIHENLTLEN